MASPSMDLSKFKKKPLKKFTPEAAEESNIRDYAAMFLRGISGFAPGGLIGAAAGGIGEGLAQTIEDREDYNFPQMGVQAGLGAIPFGKAGGLIKGMLKGGVMSGGGSVATDIAEGNEIDLPKAALATGLGSIGGGLASKLDLSKFTKKTIVTPKIKAEKEVSKAVAQAKDTTPVGPLATPIMPPIAKEGRIEPNQPSRKLDLRGRPKNPMILSTDKEAGRKIMNQILEESARAKAAKLAEPQISLQAPIVSDTTEKGSKIVSLLNLPKATAASTDLSAPLRQGIFLVGRKAWWNAWKPMVQSLREGNYNEITNSIAQNPRFIEASENGLAITTLEGLAKREEAFASSIAERIPIVGNYLIKPSERAYTTFLNKLRMDLYSDLADKADRLKAPVDKKMLSGYINAATGRGSMGLTVGGSSKTLESAAPFLNTTFFSPRLIASRVQLLNPISYVKMDPFTRKEALRDLATLTSVTGTVLALAKMNGADVDFDPTSTEFAKIKLGNTRIDPLGGFSQYVRFFSQGVEGLTTDETGPDPKRFIESKLSPSARLIFEVISEKDYFGRETTIPKSTLNAFAPMITRDIYELWKEDPDLVPLSGLAALGVGVQTYGEGGNKRKNPTGIPRVKFDMTKFKRK